jgi:hypothetical protein
MNNNPDNNILNIKVILSNLPQQTIPISILSTEKLFNLRKKIIEKLNLNPFQRVRLIFRGRILYEDEDFKNIKDIGLFNHCFIHVIIQNQRNSINTEINNLESSIRGFDRFRFFGFNDSEIQQFRYQFHSHRRMNEQFFRNNNENNNNSEYLLYLEEEWFNNEINNENSMNIPIHQVNNEEYTPYGTHLDLVKGIIMGFLLGFIMILWV